MTEYSDAIAGRMNVGLEVCCPGADRCGERVEGVLRGGQREAAMREDSRSRPGEELPPV